jgi:hypothetical protein
MDGRPSPAMMPPRRTQAPRPRRSGGRPSGPVLGRLPLPDAVLPTSLANARSVLGLNGPDAHGAAASVVGDHELWQRLDHGDLDAVALAWRRACDWSGPAGDKGWLLVALTVQHAFRGDLASLAIALTARGLNAWGTWREVNVRLSGQLYTYGMDAVHSNDRAERSAAALQLALAAWEVVAAADEGLDDSKRRIWRGMRAATRLHLARRVDDPVPLLEGARVDYAASHLAGDRTPQHYVLHLEVLHRIFDAEGDRSAMDAAAELLRETRVMPEAAGFELLFARGEHLLRRGILAMDARLDGAESARSTPLDRESDDLGNEIGADALEDTAEGTALDQVVDHALRAARSAFASSVALYTRALSQQPMGRSDPAMAALRRGIARGRQAQAQRRLGDDDEQLLVAALADLRPGEDKQARLVLPYAATLRLRLARRLLRAGLPEDAQRIAAEGLELWSQRRDDGDPIMLGLQGARVDAALVTATAFASEDRSLVAAALEEFLALLPAARNGVRAATLAYAARQLIPPVPWSPRLRPDADVEEPEPSERAVVREVVDHLEDAASAASNGGHRQFCARHAATLLALADASGPVSACRLDVVERLHTLATTAHKAVPGHHEPVVVIQFARASLRLAKCLRAEPERAADLFQDSIAAFTTQAELAGLIRDDGTPVERPDMALWAPRESDEDDPRTTVEHAVAAVPWEAAQVVDMVGLGSPAGGFTDRPQGGPDPATLASLLGEAHLRLSVLRRDAEGASAAIRWLSAAQRWGNDSAELSGLLGDAFYRRARNPRASKQAQINDLRNALRRKELARSTKSPNRENCSVSAAVASRLWRISRDRDYYASAARLALLAATSDPAWPWPVVQLAEFAEAEAESRAFLPAAPPADAASGGVLWDAVREGRSKELVQNACRLAAMSDEFTTRNLGGMGETFVLDDPHGLLSSTLVLKRLEPDQARSEHDSLRKLKIWLDERHAPAWAQVPEPLALIPDPRRTDGSLLVTRHAGGRPLRLVLAEAGTVYDPDRTVAVDALRQTVVYLGLILASRGGAPAGARGHWQDALSGRRGRARQREEGRLRRVGVRDARAFLRSWLETVPPGLPMVGKRDAHSDNWIVTERGALVALDLQAASWLPLTAEVAQLLEDTPALPVTAKGATLRQQLLHDHVDALTEKAAEPWRSAVSAVTADELHRGYEAFALLRAVFLMGKFADGGSASSSGSIAFSLDRVEHGEAVVAWLSQEAADSDLRALATTVLHARDTSL